MYRFLLFLIAPFIWVSESSAAYVWQALITEADFTGVRTDLLTTVSGIVTLLFIILGLAILYRVLGK
jgi:hypothetical protein